MAVQTFGKDETAAAKLDADKPGATEDAMPDQPEQTAQTIDGHQERRRTGNGLAIGGPLTAAFIGGFLVIENLAGADQPEEGSATTPDGNALLVGGESEAGTDEQPLQNASAETGPSASGGGTDPADPAAAPSEDGAIQIGGSGIDPGPITAPIAATTSGITLPDGPEGGGSGPDLSFFSINIGTGDTNADDIDPIVEDEVISRKRQVGTPGDDVLIGTDGHDDIRGAEGDDIIKGQGGSDVLNGNGGDDQLFGGAGRDRLDGGFGNDVLDGGDDNDLDLLKGGGGDDILIVHGQNDIALDSGAGGANGGEDLLVVRQSLADDLPSGADGFTFAYAENLGIDLPEGSAGARRIVGDNIENVTLEGSANHDIFADSYANRLTDNSGDNLIRAGGGDDILAGGGGHDDLSGDAGDDRIEGGAGDDIIRGGLGRDELYGEGGDDVYVIGLNDSAIDTVFDHEGANRLKLDGITDQSVEASLLGDDLYVTVDQVPVALVSDYVGHEDSLAGIDFGQGLRSIDTLLIDRPDLADAVDEAERNAAEAAGDDLLSAHLHLTEPTHAGAPRTDERLDGTEGDDWLSGFDGKDVLFGHEGNDILEGGDGSDQLRGGGGDDRYLFSKGERGIDKIQDNEGRNLAELKGYDRADIEGAMLGDDLAVLADGKVLFTVDDFASNDGAFQGVQAGNKFIPTEDLLA